MNLSDGKIYACSMFSIVTEHQMYMKLLNGKIYTCSLFLIVTEHLYEALKWKDLCMFSVFNRKIYACSMFSILIEYLYEAVNRKICACSAFTGQLNGPSLGILFSNTITPTPPRVSQCMGFQTFTMHPFRLGDLPTI